LPSDRSATVLLALAFSNALIHALIPSHWLAFAIVGRANRWPNRTTLTVTALAGAGHVLFILALGFVVARAGKEAAARIPPYAEHVASSVVLIALGIVFLIRGMRQSGCVHPGHHHGGPRGEASTGRAPGVISALVLGMTLSPCIELLSVYLAAATFSWQVIGFVSLVMAATTLSLMILLVWLTLIGLERLRLDWLERNEGYVVAAVLIVLGVFILTLH
jgi:nickel/cobalt transporter (NicO) family protein